jgi:uncharacterized protein YggE
MEVQINNNITKFLNFPFITAIGIAMLTFGLFVVLAFLSVSNNVAASAQQTSSSAQTDNLSNNSNTHTLYITGIATSKVKSDKFVLNLGVQTTNKTADVALTTNSEKLSKVIAALKTADVKDNETSTSSFNISPDYIYSQPSSNTAKITGFTVSNSIQIESSSIDKVSKWIDIAVAAGSNNVNNVGFVLSDKKVEEIKNNLIKQAINNARTKADIAASALGLKGLAVKSINLNEVGAHLPEPFLAKDSLAAGISPANTATPIISGEQQVSVTVSMVFVG